MLYAYTMEPFDMTPKEHAEQYKAAVIQEVETKLEQLIAIAVDSMPLGGKPQHRVTQRAVAMLRKTWSRYGTDDADDADDLGEAGMQQAAEAN